MTLKQSYLVESDLLNELFISTTVECYLLLPRHFSPTTSISTPPSVLERAWSWRKENSSFEVYPDFPVELDTLLSGVKNFSQGGGVFSIVLLHSSAGNLCAKDVCVWCL